MKTVTNAPLKAQHVGVSGWATPEGDLHLYLADCLEGLDWLAPNSVHLCLTDPPYFLDGMGDDWPADRLKDGKEKAGVVGGMRVGMKVCPAKAGVFSGKQSHQGNSQKPCSLDSQEEGN